MAQTVDYRIGRITDLRLPEGANFAAEFTFSGLSLTGYEATLTARRGANGGRVPFTWSKSGISLTSTTVSFDIGPATTDDAGKAFSTVTAQGSTDYAMTIRQSGGGAIVMRLQGTVQWVEDVGDYDPGTSGSNQIAVTVGSGTAVTVSLTNNGHSPLSLDATTADVLTVNNQVLSADDAGSDKLLFWDDSEGKLSHAAIGSGLTMTGTTLSASGGAGTGTVTSVAVSGSDGIEVDSGSPITASGTIALGVNASTLKSHISLNNVENTALSTWAGSANITTLGTIATGTVPAANVSGLGDAATKNTGTTAGTVAAGDHTHAQLHDAATIAASASDVFSVSGQAITADDPGADRLIFWDESENKLTHLTAGSGLTISGTTITATGGGDVTGPASSVDNRIPIFVGTGGKTIEDSGVTLTPAFAGTSEVFTIDFSAVSDPGNIWSGWLVIHDDAGSVGLWWRESTQANNAPVGLIADRLIQINITIPPANEIQYIATETAAALDADSAFSASASGTVVTCTVTAPAAITGSFSSEISGLAAACTVTTEGADPYIASISQIDGSLIEDIDPLKIDATGTTDYTTFLRGDGSWAVPAYPPSLSDGDKGHITVSYGTTWLLNNGVVSLEKMANMATASLLGRSTAGTGSPEVLSASTARSLLNVADGANNYSHPNHTGDVTSTGDGATTIANDAVTTAKIINDAVTYAKLQNISATSRILGRKTAAAGDAEECTLSEILDFVGSAAQGDIFYRGASSWTRLAAGTSGHYLKTLGSGANPEWAAASASSTGWNLVDEGTADSVASITEDGCFADYTEYELVFYGLKTDVHTAAVYVRLRTSESDVTSTYSTVWDGRNSGAANIGGISGVTTGWVLQGINGTGTGQSGSGYIKFWPKAGTEQRCLFHYGARASDTGFGHYIGGGAISGYTTNVTGFKLYVSGGNMDGTWRLFGR